MGHPVVRMHLCIQISCQRTQRAPQTDLSGRDTPIALERCVCACYPETLLRKLT